MPSVLAHATSAGQYVTGIDARRLMSVACSVDFPIARPTRAGPPQRAKISETVIMGWHDTKRIATSQDETYRMVCDADRMNEQAERLKLARERAGFIDATSAARAFGWNEVTYRAHEKGTRGLKLPVAQRYAERFKVSAAWLMTGDGEAPGPPLASASEVRPIGVKPIAIPIIGKTEAGTFREVVEYDDDEPEYVFDEPDPEFPRARQIAFVVEGDSMNEAVPPILPGARLICVDFEETGLPLIEGMIVVVERTQDAGQTREWSVKQVEIDGEVTLFQPRSSNKRHKPIVMKDDPDMEPRHEARVIALVRSVSYSVSTGGRRR